MLFRLFLDVDTPGCRQKTRRSTTTHEFHQRLIKTCRRNILADAICAVDRNTDKVRQIGFGHTMCHTSSPASVTHVARFHFLNIR